MISLLRSHTTSSLVGFTTLALSLTWIGCDEKESKRDNDSGAGKGGTDSSAGGDAGMGGSGISSGGATFPSAGGDDSAGTSTAGGSQAASGGAAATETAGSGNDGTAPTPCSSDIECKSLKQLCDLTIKRCVQCIQSADCSDGTACVAGVCGGTPGCKTNADCSTSAEGKACDVARGRCVPCVAASDCSDPSTSECVSQRCVTFTTCTNSLACTSATAPVCDRTLAPGRCVQCIADADCVASGAGKVCADHLCRTGCSADSNCTEGTKCNTSLVPNVCAACATNSDCPAAQYCSKGSCVADRCAPGVDQACISNGIATCNSDGDGFGAPEACPSGQTCSVTQSRASCGGGSVVTPTVCATTPGTVDPCTKLSAFTGTQILDGKGDDFCSVPAFELSFKSAAGVNNNKASGGSTSAYTQRAVAQIAWSADGLHAFVSVEGTPVRSNTTIDKPWDGDAIELMLATSDNVTGLTSRDANAIHIIANYGVAVAVKSDGSSGSHTALSSDQFKGTLTTTGYAVELELPWPNGAAPSSGARVRFDMALNVDSASVDPSVQGRDAQAVLAMTALTGATSCATAPATPFCDDRLWCPTTLE